MRQRKTKTIHREIFNDNFILTHSINFAYFDVLKIVSSQNSEALETVLGTAARLEAGLKIQHERLRKEDLDL